MILIDLSQIMVASTMMSMGKDQSEVDVSMVRHMVLNSLRMYRSKYHKEYGELILCCDGRHSWRRDHFPQYKASRKLIEMLIVEIGHKYLDVLILSNPNLKSFSHTSI